MINSKYRAFVVASIFGAVLGACESGKINGRVIPGPGSVVMVIDDNDPRVKNEGIAGTNIVVRRSAGEGQNGSIVASGVSEASGEFRLPLSDLDAERHELVLTATTPDKRVSKGRIFFPAPGKQVLVVVREER